MITTTGLHGIRAMAYLAEQPKGTRIGAAEIAHHIHAPPNYLGKLLQTLGTAGLLTSHKGRGGGFELARSAKKISLYDVLDPIERLSDQPACFFGWKKCSDEKPCAMHNKWKSRRESIHSLLKEVSIHAVAQGEIME